MNTVLDAMKVRKIEWLCADTYREAGAPVTPALRKVAALVVLANPALAAGSDEEGMRLLAHAASAIGEVVMPRLGEMLETQAASYGKAAIVGTDGELEHGAGLIHPTLGKPMRAAIGGGAAVIPSNLKVAPQGTPIDVPLGHRNEPWSFDEIDTLTVASADAPRPAEILLVMALASGGRPHARVRKA
jgi:hypothetical protein